MAPRIRLVSTGSRHPVRFPTLRRFCLSRFHQDWQLDSATDNQVVVEFTSTENPEYVDEVIREVRALLEEDLPDEELCTMLFREYGLSLDPHKYELTMKEWLERLLRLLEEERSDR